MATMIELLAAVRQVLDLQRDSPPPVADLEDLLVQANQARTLVQMLQLLQAQGVPVPSAELLSKRISLAIAQLATQRPCADVVAIASFGHTTDVTGWSGSRTTVGLVSSLPAGHPALSWVAQADLWQGRYLVLGRSDTIWFARADVVTQTLNWTEHDRRLLREQADRDSRLRQLAREQYEATPEGQAELLQHRLDRLEALQQKGRRGKTAEPVES